MFSFAARYVYLKAGRRSLPFLAYSGEVAEQARKPSVSKQRKSRADVHEALVKGVDGNGKRCVRDIHERRDANPSVSEQDIISSVLPLPKHLNLFDKHSTLPPRVFETVYFCSPQLKAVASIIVTQTGLLKAQLNYPFISSGHQATTTSYRNLGSSFHLLQVSQAVQPLIRCHPPILVTKHPPPPRLFRLHIRVTTTYNTTR